MIGSIRTNRTPPAGSPIQLRHSPRHQICALFHSHQQPKGIVQSLGPTVFELMDLPLVYLAAMSDEPLPAGMDDEQDHPASPAWSAAAD